MASGRGYGVLHVVNTLGYGGLERVVCDLAVQQHAQGHRVAVFSLYAADGLRGELDSSGIPVVIGDKRGALDPNVLRLLRAGARDADIVHTHNFMPNYYAAMATLGLRSGPAIVNTCHNMGSSLSGTRLRWLYRWSLRRTARVAMVGAQVHAHFVGSGMVRPAQAATVLNGVPVNLFRNDAAQRDEARARLGIAGDALVVGSVGRLVELKNHRLLLSCVPQLAASHPRLTVAIIGGGPLEAELRAYAAELGIADRVVFTGARDDVAALLPGLDIFALPSRTEGLSIALLEACATGLAMVASAVGGNPEIVRDGATGRLFASDDRQALHAVLNDLLGDAPQRRRLAAAARDWVHANGSIESMRANYDRIYAEALRA